MSEAASTPNFNANLIPTALQLNTALRTGTADLAHLLQYLVASASVPGAGLVMGGLEVGGKTNDMRVDVLAGYGAVYNGSVAAPEHPLEAVVLREDDTSPALEDGDGTHPRIDVISVDPSSSLFDKEPLLIPNGGGATQDAFTRRGPGYEILVTTGTPAASPVVPGTPSGSLKLAQVLVPAGLTAAGGGTASATITDYRNRAGAYIKGPSATFSGYVQQISDWAPAGVVALIQAYGVQDAANKVLAYGVDRDKHWPAVFRSGVPAGDATASLYSMVIAGGRSFPLSAPFNGGESIPADATINFPGFVATAFAGVRVSHVSASSTTARASASFQTPARGASFDGYKLRYEVLTASPSTLAARAVVYDASTGSIVNLSSLTNITKTVGSHVATLDSPVEFVPDEGDIVGIRVDIGFAAAADNAAVECRDGIATVTEGRA